jgi:hypothetical protein
MTSWSVSFGLDPDVMTSQNSKNNPINTLTMGKTVSGSGLDRAYPSDTRARQAQDCSAARAGDVPRTLVFMASRAPQASR